MPIRMQIRRLLRTAAYCKETRQWAGFNECKRELLRLIPQRERTVVH